MDLNADVGEGAGDDAAVLAVVTSANVACGVHAGDADTMRRTVDAARERDVVVGAHPSYPDRAGYGRRPMALTPAQIAEEVLAQVGALDDIARDSGTRVHYVKPHGALYHRLAEDEDSAGAVAEALQRRGDLVLLMPAGSLLIPAVRAMGVTVATEAFADRGYLPDARLVPRADPAAVITDAAEVGRRVKAIAVDHRVTAIDGSPVAISADSICVHGDTPGAAQLAVTVRRSLETSGVALAPFAP
jgi:5-oxoprolinase (ATP-hydrolysing) subunit A